MALEEKERIIIPDENGEEHLFEVLFTFDVDESGHSYVAVVPAEQKEDEEVEVFAFRYEEKANDDDLELYHIESEEEWDMVEEVLNTIADTDLTE
ncbi:DUF1292 domain-containing protein [Gracilibacillus alcaliphilus]|uniref:DUF1292 domain-containing protein n=1 Tax=Gracilibacillus alcaliphilus TaxID=1401441 RepID=UPI00195635C7|nr:uncharacterized protein YrzB (UPF0473 family) [Gracilibacillus alcaliphilus]